MPLTIRHTILGIELSFGDRQAFEPPQRQPDADQEHPRRHYIYAHVDMKGKIFYIGKGVDRRAWSTDRHDLWHRYVKGHLGGHYRVEILADNIATDAEASVLEADWIFHLGGQLVNWTNTGRQPNYKAMKIFHKRRDANRDLVVRAKEMEKSDLQRAADMYIEAIAAIPAYACLRTEGGLVGQLREEEEQERGRSGYIEPLDRLTMCLTKLGRFMEAKEHVEKYFELFPGDRVRAMVSRIEKRIAKGIAQDR